MRLSANGVSQTGAIPWTMRVMVTWGCQALAAGTCQFHSETWWLSEVLGMAAQTFERWTRGRHCRLLSQQSKALKDVVQNDPNSPCFLLLNLLFLGSTRSYTLMIAYGCLWRMPPVHRVHQNPIQQKQKHLWLHFIERDGSCKNLTRTLHMDLRRIWIWF